MKITAKKDRLLTAVISAEKFMAKEGAYEQQIVLKGQGSKMQVLSTDNVNTFIAKDITFSSDSLTDDSFSPFSVNGKKLLTVLKAAKTDEVTLTLASGFVFIKSGRSNVKLEVFVKTQEIVVSEARDKIILSKKILTGFKQILHSAGVNNSKFELNGILLQINSSTINIVGTDTHRLAVITTDSETNIEKDLIIPFKAIDELNKMFSTHDFVEAELSDNSLTINTDVLTFSTKLINGKYPEWRRIIPSSVEQTLSIERARFVELIKEASLLIDEVIVDISNGTITLKDSEENTKVVDTIADNNTNMKFCISARYALGFLNSYTEDKVQVAYNGTNVPLMFIANPDYKEVIMPIVYEDEDQGEKEAA